MGIRDVLTVYDVEHGLDAAYEAGSDGVSVVFVACCDEILAWDVVFN